MDSDLREVIAAAARVGRGIDVSQCHYGPIVGKGEVWTKAPAYYTFLAGLTALVQPHAIVEIGTHFGGSARAFATALDTLPVGANKKRVITVDVEDRTEGKGFPESVTRHVGDIFNARFRSQVLRDVKGRKPAILYIDALKDGDFIARVLAAFKSQKFDWILFDDIATTPSMQRKWAELARGTLPGLDISDVIHGLRDAGYGMGLLPGSPAALNRALQRARSLSGRQDFASVRMGSPYEHLPSKQAAQVPPRKAWYEAIWPFQSSKAEPVVSRPQFMMRPEELGVLHRIARERYRGFGEIVDAGTFLGASAVALASGLDARTDRIDHLGRIHSYDLFLNSSAFFDKFLDADHPRFSLFLDVFAKNTQQHKSYINVYPGDFSKMRWCGKPIEIFFCDIAKSQTLNAHVYLEFMPWWIPGETVYVQQDFVHLEAPWIQYALGSIADSFDVLGVEAPSLVLGYRKHPTASALARIAADDFTLNEKLASLDRLVEKISDRETRATLNLMQAQFCAGAGREAEAKRRFETCAAEYADVPASAIKARFKKVAGQLRIAEYPGKPKPPPKPKVKAPVASAKR